VFGSKIRRTGYLAGRSGRIGGMLFILLSAAALPTTNASAQTLTTLYSFNFDRDGGEAFGGLISDSSGNLYGTTPNGGPSLGGTAFELVNSSGNYTEKLLYSFTGGSDGGRPYAGLIADASGNLYGTTPQAGAGSGTVFKISGGGFVPPIHFAGVPGARNCTGASVSSLAHTYGGVSAAAKALGYTSVSALQNAISAYCGN
jgi:hypothetical protein